MLTVRDSMLSTIFRLIVNEKCIDFTVYIFFVARNFSVLFKNNPEKSKKTYY